MKILVFNGSPKKEKSDTMHITRAFLDGMREAAAQEIRTIDVTDKHIEFCRGCFVCKYNGGHCAIDDDMREILEQMLGSDLLLFSYPLYCYGMPAGLKNLIDRTLPLSSMAMKEVNGRYIHVDQRDYSHLRYLMICGCGFPNSRRNFEPAVRQFELLFPNNHTILTVPESPMFNAPEAAVVTVPRLELVRRAGRQYAQTGQIDTALLAEIGSPMIPEELYAKIVNGMKTHIANIITGIRILGSILLAFVPVFSAVFYTVYLTCGLSDMADGMIARKTNNVSSFGARFDTAADFLFAAVSLVKLLPYIPVPRWLWKCVPLEIFCDLGIIKIGTLIKERHEMPEICRFYGIVIKMFFKPKEHEPSHLYALYGGTYWYF